MKLAAHDPYAVVMCIICVRPIPRVPESKAPFSKLQYIHTEKSCVSNSFHSFQII